VFEEFRDLVAVDSNSDREYLRFCISDARWFWVILRTFDSFEPWIWRFERWDFRAVDKEVVWFMDSSSLLCRRWDEEVLRESKYEIVEASGGGVEDFEDNERDFNEDMLIESCLRVLAPKSFFCSNLKLIFIKKSL